MANERERVGQVAPLPEGIRTGDKAPTRPFEVSEKRFSAAATLGELQEEFGFYTPALLHLFIPMPVDPVHHFCMEQKEEVQPFSLKFNRPIFRGLEAPNGDADWNHVLFGLARPAFEDFIRFIGTVAWTSRLDGSFTRVRTQELSIVDPLVLDQAAVLPTPVPLVSITVLGLDSTLGCYHLQPSNNPVLSPPKLVSSTVVFPETQAFADALVKTAENPYSAVDATKEPRRES